MRLPARSTGRAKKPRTTHVRRLAIVAGLLLVGSTLFGLAGMASASASTYQPPELTNPAVQSATLTVALKYANVEPGLNAQTLRWFLYAIEHRESTFTASVCNYNDGAQSWNSPPSESWFWPTSDHVPHGCGLTQTTGWQHEGMPFPWNAQISPQWLNLGIYGWVKAPAPIPPLYNPFDPTQNLERFVTEHVLPVYQAIHAKYPWWSTDQVLRAVAFHWNMGDYVPYNPSNCAYLCLYDQYVSEYKGAVLSDTTWPGASTGTVSFSVSPNVNNWWVEVYANPSAGSGSVTSVSASVNGGGAVPLAHNWWGSWATVTHVPAGSSVVFTATTSSGSTSRSAPVIWR